MDKRIDDDAPPPVSGQVGRIALILAGGFGALFCVGVIAGIMAAHIDDGGGPMKGVLIAILAGAGVLALGAIYAAWRGIKGFRAANQPHTKRERRYQNVMGLSVVIGAVMGVVIAAAGFDPDAVSPFASTPLPAGIAIAMALVIGIGIPLLSLYWHKNAIDEQEAAAYSKGALYAIYAFWIVAPVWWLLWRGGLVPAPDGVALYFGTIVISGIVWFWAKYR